MNYQRGDGAQLWRRKYTLLFAAIAVVLIFFSWNYVEANRPNDVVSYRFANVKRSDLKISTLATGRLKAIDAVEVSSQLSGQVVKLNASFNDKVKSGSPLAQLDDKTFKAAVALDKARLAHAKASYDTALAKIAGAKARYEAAYKDYQRKTALKKAAAISMLDVDTTRAKMVTAESELNAARADESVQQAAIEEAEASLHQAQINLARTIIRSPIDGIVINRTVELGQTVAVSMEAPTLFTITRDLSHMHVNGIVDEADIGQIRVGQHVQFSVDAYPNRIFTGRVIEIHRAPKIVQNVVAYTIVTSAENRDLALLPGMTAMVHIITTERPHALVVPNAALRFQPKTATGGTSGGKAAAGNGRLAHVWVRTGSGSLSRAEIRTGASDGSITEVVSGPLAEGQAIAVGTRVIHREKRFFGIRLGS
jgi:HlyD family secretion protein